MQLEENAQIYGGRAERRLDGFKGGGLQEKDGGDMGYDFNKVIDADIPTVI
jgi:hypothetical protein